MSSILKALKKLEEEQAGRASGSSSPTGGQLVTPVRTARPMVLVLGGVSAGLLLAILLFVMLGKQSEVPVQPVAEPLAEKSNAVPHTPPEAPAAAQPATLSSPVSALPGKAPVSSPTSKVASSPGTKAGTPAPAGKEQIERQTMPQALPGIAAKPGQGAVDHVEIKRREIPAPGLQWSAPHLTVTEILPVSGGERMAIVNDLPVMEGTVVDGAVVSEIQADRVIFTIDGRSVGVPLSAH